MRKATATILILAFLTTGQVEPKKSFVQRHKNLVTAAAVVGGGVLATATAYCIIRSIPIKPTPTNLTCFGNEEGQPLLYCHGVTRSAKDVFSYAKIKQKFYLFDQETHHVATFNFPDSPYKRRQVSLGQENDVLRLKKALLKFVGKIENEKKIVIYATSRGGATAINLLGNLDRFGKEGELIRSRVGALIVESPPASIPETISYIFKQKRFLGYIPFIGKIAHFFAPLLYPKYKRNGLQAIESIKTMPNIPVLIIHSETDKTCPVKGSLDLYKTLASQGRENIYRLITPSGNHGCGLFDEHQQEVFSVIQAFFKSYGFPHDPDAANSIDLQNYQPKLE